MAAPSPLAILSAWREAGRWGLEWYDDEMQGIKIGHSQSLWSHKHEEKRKYEWIALWISLYISFSFLHTALSYSYFSLSFLAHHSARWGIFWSKASAGAPSMSWWPCALVGAWAQRGYLKCATKLGGKSHFMFLNEENVTLHSSARVQLTLTILLKGISFYVTSVILLFCPFSIWRTISRGFLLHLH